MLTPVHQELEKFVLVANVSKKDKLSFSSLIRQYYPHNECHLRLMYPNCIDGIQGDVFDATSFPHLRWDMVIIPKVEHSLQRHSSESFESMLETAMSRVIDGGYLVVSRNVMDETKQAFYNIFPQAYTTLCEDVEYVCAKKM